MSIGKSDYDPFAKVYDKYWGPRYSNYALQTLSVLLPAVQPPAKLLDLCCGSGQTSQRLAAHGFQVTGVDNSRALIALARKNAPSVTFVEADVRKFLLPVKFDAAISLSDSLNHLLSLDDLQSTFVRVFESIVPGGRFLFDLNLAHKYVAAWTGSMSFIEDDMVCAIVSSRDLDAKRATFDAAIFSRSERLWTRSDAHITQTWYDPAVVQNTLQAVGFGETRITDATGRPIDDWATSKAYFTCLKP